ncbi:MAG: ABC transporter ATP-binding protein [Oscillospiraceae bacterium]|jgi:spermidine/putrescine transport system ATP-binding protein|nr:ABC transporter ATP-binding protein [Oscillospiraceae bacterium]
MSGELIRLAELSMAYDGETVLDNINLNIKDREFLTLLGPSGCGKTTTLRIIGGFEAPTAGDVYFDGVRINNLPPYKRRVNTVFQKYALFPHLNVYENVAFGLRISKVREAEIARRVGESLELVGLAGYDRRRVHQLSGGQQQRVAIARAVVNRPQVLLLDEPLGALDLKLRKEMQTELKAIQQQVGITFVYVTHDQEEALTMSDTVVVMNKGIIMQVGTPMDIYNEPINAFVADFIGESNIITGVMHSDYHVEFASAQWECVDTGFDPHQNVDVVIRPEDIRLTNPENAPISGVVKSVTFKGVHYESKIEQGDIEWTVHSTAAPVPGTRVGISLTPEDLHIMDKPEEFRNPAAASRESDVLAEEEGTEGGVW